MSALPHQNAFADAVPWAIRCERRAVTLSAFASRPDGTGVELTIVDLSFDGCGVLCAEELCPGEPLEQATPTQPRRYERISVAGEAWLRRSAKRQFRVHIYDLSPLGCKAEFVERPEVSEQLWIKFDQLEALEAEVRWIAGPRTGLEFTRPIHPAVFNLLVARHGV